MHSSPKLTLEKRGARPGPRTLLALLEPQFTSELGQSLGPQGGEARAAERERPTKPILTPSGHYPGQADLAQDSFQGVTDEMWKARGSPCKAGTG